MKLVVIDAQKLLLRSAKYVGHVLHSAIGVICVYWRTTVALADKYRV